MRLTEHALVIEGEKLGLDFTSTEPSWDDLKTQGDSDLQAYIDATKDRIEEINEQTKDLKERIKEEIECVPRMKKEKKAKVSQVMMSELRLQDERRCQQVL